MINNDAQTIRSAAILTNGYVSATIQTVTNASQLNVLVQFTKGSLTSASLKFEYSNDGTTWYQETFEALSGGVSTATAGIHTFDTTGNYQFSLPNSNYQFRVSAIGTGTVTSSSMRIDLQQGNA